MLCQFQNLISIKIVKKKPLTEAILSPRKGKKIIGISSNLAYASNVDDPLIFKSIRNVMTPPS